MKYKNQKFDENQKFIIILLFSIIVYLLILSCYIKLFENTWLNFSYIKYLTMFYKSHYSYVLGYKIPLPFYFILALFFTTVTCITILVIIKMVGKLSNNKKINPDFSFWATWSDIKKFKKGGVNVTEKHGLVLGVVNTGLFNHYIFADMYGSKNIIAKKIGAFFLAWNKYFILNWFIGYRFLTMSEPLSVMCVAPAGAGKSVSVAKTSINNADKDNVIVNDPKGELYNDTHKYREQVLGSKIIKLNWGSEDSSKWNPLDRSNFSHLKGTDSFYIKINEFCDRLANILIQESGNDPFWSNSARGLFVVCSLYLVHKRDSEGKSTSVSEVRDFCNTVGVAVTEDELEEENNKDKTAPSMIKFKTNKMIAFLDELIMTGTDMTELARIAIEKIITALRSQSSKEEKQRETFLQTIEASTKIFNNPRVALNTSSNDISFEEIRKGIKRKGQPNQLVTIYMIVPASEQASYGLISGLFVEFMYQSVVSMPEPKKGSDDKMIRVILDEVAFFPPISAIEDAPAITRSFWISWLFMCQDLEQFKAKWGEKGLENMKTNTACKIILTQNNHKSAITFSEMIGKTQVKDTKGKGQHKETILIEKLLITPTQIMSLKKKQILLTQGNAGRPVMCYQPAYYKYPDFMNKTALAKNTNK